MSRTVYVWTDFDDDAEASDWYEDVHIPSIVRELGFTAQHTERVQNKAFQDISGINGFYMTVFRLPELPDGKEHVVQDLQTQIRPAPDSLSRYAQVNTRIYTSLGTYLGREWRGGMFVSHSMETAIWLTKLIEERDVRMWVVIRYQPDEAILDQFIKFCAEVLGPKMIENPNLLRLEFFQVDRGSSLKDGAYRDRDAKSFFPFMTTWEFRCNEIPEELLMYVIGSKDWLYYVENDLIVGRCNNRLRTC